jgi:hypothetical protein
MITGEGDGLDDVSHSNGTGDQARPPVDMAIPDLAGLRIAVIAGSDEGAAQALLECCDGGFLQDGVRPTDCSNVQVCHRSLLPGADTGYLWLLGHNHVPRRLQPHDLHLTEPCLHQECLVLQFGALPCPRFADGKHVQVDGSSQPGG